MARIKRGTAHIKKRKRLLKKTKGYTAGRKNKIKLAKTAVRKAGAYAHRDRRNKKRLSRKLWQININAAARKYDVSYSKLIHLLKSKNIELDRKVLAQLAENHPKIFEKIVEGVKQ